MVGQSPPTTSGIVIISGSNNFGVGSDFPVFVLTLDLSPALGVFPDVLDMPVNDATSSPLGFGNLKMLDNYIAEIQDDMIADFDPADQPPSFSLEIIEDYINIFDVTPFQFAPSDDSIKITSTNVTTSGIVILDLFPGAGEGFIPFVPPVFLNKRIFPVTFSGLGERLFPEENRRIYPVLPQFSVITPGD
jgi:hypothetical protein